MAPTRPEGGDFADALASATRSAAVPDWMKAVQGEALRRFQAAGFPTTKLEDWRYTDLRDFAERLRGLSRGDATAGLPAPTAQGLPVSGMGMVAVFQDGALLEDQSRLDVPAGLAVTRLHGVDSRAAWEGSLSRDASGEADALAALNAALLSDGLAVDVAPGWSAPAPLYVACLSGPHRAGCSRLVLRLRAGSTATLVEHHLGDGSGWFNAVTDIVCEPGARLTYVRLQDSADTAMGVATQRVRLEAGAAISLLGIDLGAAMARNTLVVTLDGPDADADINALFFADGNRHLDNQTRVDHRAPRTRCREKFRGIVDGKGRGVFNGKIVVHAGADKTDAQLRNENLLLSRNAEIDTKPELEIYADDVKCAHGATTGQLDPASIFYLRSRGIDEAEARRLLIAAFAREIIGRIPVKALEDHVVEGLASRLPDVASVGAAP